jgi:hypothetical protein
MSCPFCAVDRPGRFDANCHGCTARHIAGLPYHLRVAKYEQINTLQGREAAIAMQAAVNAVRKQRRGVIDGTETRKSA